MEWEAKLRMLTPQQRILAEQLKERGKLTLRDLIGVYSSKQAGINAIERLIYFKIAKLLDYGVWGLAE